MKLITKRLRVLRIERDLTQRDIALRAKIPVGRYWEIENGYRVATPDEARLIAAALKAEAQDIFAVAS